MTSRYGGITGSKRISEDFQNINTAFEKVQTEMDANSSVVEQHITSKTAHNADSVTYTGEATGDNVKQAIDGLDTRIDNIVAQSGDDITELVDARGGYPVLSGRMDAYDVKLLAKAEKTELDYRGINALYPPAPLVAAKGDGTNDDTDAIQNMINHCISNNKKLLIPQCSAEYKITGELKILRPIQIEMDALAQIKFYPSTADSVLFYINTMTNTIFNWGTLKLGKLVSATTLNGVAIHVDSCGAKNIATHFIQGFKKGVYLTNEEYNCLGNEIYFDLMTQCETGVHILSSANMMEGNVIRFNFITEGKYGITLERSGAGSCSLNQVFGNAIHMTLESCIAINIPNSTNLPYGNEFNIKGFIGADNGLIIGGNRTVGGEPDFAWGRHNVFRLYCNSPTNIAKMALANEVYNNYNIYSHAVSDAGYTSVDTRGESGFNSGVALNTNHSLFSVSMPPGAAGDVVTKYAYHQFLGHNDPKLIQVLPVSNTSGLFPNDIFLVQAIDNSPVSNRELAIRITYLKTTNTAKTIKFFLKIE